MSHKHDNPAGTGARPARPARKPKGNRIPKGKRPPGPVWRRVLVRFAQGLVGLLVLALLAFFAAYMMIDIPDPNEDFQAETSLVYYADGRSELGSFAVQNRQLVVLDQVPQHVQDAVIAPRTAASTTTPAST